MSLTGGNRILELPRCGDRGPLRIPYSHRGQLFHSPGRGTFGGFDSSDFCEREYGNPFTRLRSEFPIETKFRIVLPPEYYLPEMFLPQIAQAREVAGLTEVLDVNHHVEIGENPELSLSKGNKKRLRQFREAGGTCGPGRLTGLEDAIDLLSESRVRLGASLSLSKEDIEMAFTTLPQTYKLVEARVGGELAAAAITVRISDSVNYVLYWGDDATRWRHLSPVVALFIEIHDQTRKGGFDVLDLGVSSVNGTVNPGLRRFKIGLGALETNRITLCF